MIIAPTEMPEQPAFTDPTELLIKEARANTRRRRARWMVGIIVAAVISLLFAYVSSLRPGSSPSVSNTSNTSSAVVPECATPNLKLVDRGTSVATGHWIQLFQLTNIGGHACSITGYPKIALATSKGPSRTLVVTGFKGEAVIGIGDTQRGPIPAAHLAGHGGTASFWIAGADFPSRDAGCSFATNVFVTLSGEKTALVYNVGRIPFHYCQNVLSVTPILSGRSGSIPSQSLKPFALER